MAAVELGGSGEVLAGVLQRARFGFQAPAENGEQVSGLAHDMRPGIEVVGGELPDFVCGDGQQTDSSSPADSRITNRRINMVFATPHSRGELVPNWVCAVPSSTQPGQGQIAM